MDLYEMLKARKVGWSNDFLTNIYAKAFGGSQPAREQEYTGTVPYTFTADGTPLLDWYIKGNTVQNGTPSPNNSVEVNGVGERTGNLINAQPFTIEGDSSSHHILLWSGTLPTGTYTVSLNQDDNLTSAVRNTIRLIIGDTVYLESTNENYHLQSGQHEMTFTISDSSQNVEIRYWGNALSNVSTYSDIMLNTGSTLLPYEPYGYNIPILCGGTVNDVYIGTNPLRKSHDGTAVDELSSSGTLTQRVDADGSVLPAPVITQIDTPTIPTANGTNTFDVNTTVKPSEVYIKYYK